MENEKPITILLDGLYGWHRRWRGLLQKLEKTVGPAHIWEYPNHGGIGLDIIANNLGNYLIGLQKPFHLVGFSMGGILGREMMRQFPDLPLRRAVFLHVPHSGSILTYCLPLVALKQMRPKSAFLARLDAAPWSYPTFVTWCPTDLVVIPGSSARWSKANLVHKSNMPAHLWPAFSPRIHQRIIKFLQKDSEQSDETDQRSDG